MSRVLRFAPLLALAACATGSRPDDNTGQVDAAPVQVDGAPGTDAPLPIDAPRPIGAEPHVDAAMILPDACVPTPSEKLGNPAFDQGQVIWNETPITDLPGGPYPIISSPPSGLATQSGAYVAWFGGAAGFDANTPRSTCTDSLDQSIAIPAGATGLVISGYYYVATSETAGDPAADTFSLDLVNTAGVVVQPIKALDNTMTTSAWTAFSVPITASIAGTTIRVRAGSSNDILYATSFFLDSLSLTSTSCP